MVTICYNLQLNEYFSPKFTQDDPLWTFNRCLEKDVSKFNIFLSGHYKICCKSNKNFNYSNYCKAPQYILGFKVSGHLVIQGRQNRGTKSGY